MIDLKKFLNEDQDPKAVEKIVEKVKELLIINESLEYIAVQRKPTINLSPECIALTNKRVIFCRPKNLGFSMEFEDFLWKDVGDTHIKEDLEEKRAAAGGVTVNNNTSSTQLPNSNLNLNDDPTVVLQKLKNLLDNGILSQDEFERKKTEILSRM